MIGDQGNLALPWNGGGTLEMAGRRAGIDRLSGQWQNPVLIAGFWKQRGDGRLPAKRFNEADIDFDAMDGELAKLVPPKLSLRMFWTVYGSGWSCNRPKG